MAVPARSLIPMHIIPWRLSGQKEWRLNDVSLSLRGDKIALSGEIEEQSKTFVRVYRVNPGNEETFRGNSLLYQKEYEEGIRSPTWFGRRISFMEQDHGEVLVTCWDNQAEVIDVTTRKVIKTGQLQNGFTKCMSVSGGQIFIGRNSHTVDIYNKELIKTGEITLNGLRDVDFPCDIAAAEDGTLLVCTYYGKAGIYLQADGSKREDYSNPSFTFCSIAKNNHNGERGEVVLLSSGVINIYSTDRNGFFCYVDHSVSLVRINNGKIVTGSKETGTVEIFHLLQEINVERVLDNPPYGMN